MPGPAPRANWLWVAYFLASPLLSAGAALLLEDEGLLPAFSLPPAWLARLRIALAVVATLSLLQLYLPALHRRAGRPAPDPAGSEATLLNGLLISVSPTAFALLLCFLGGPARHVLYSAVISIAAVIAWAIYLTRRGDMAPL